ERGARVKVCRDPGKFYLIGMGEGKVVDFPPADDKGQGIVLYQFQRLFQGMDHNTIVIRYFVIGVPGNHNMNAVWQGLGKAFESFPSHYYFMARGTFLKMFKIVGQMPDQVIVLSQPIVLGRSRYDG